jgi:hypothetical protein
MQILGGLIVSLHDLPSSVRGLLVLQMLGGGYVMVSVQSWFTTGETYFIVKEVSDI